jgi:hypothetical protein
VEEQREVEGPLGEVGRSHLQLREGALDLSEADHAAEIVQVVTEFGRRCFDPADGDDELAGLAGLDDVVERVVLEDHRQRGVGGEVEGVPELRALGE